MLNLHRINLVKSNYPEKKIHKLVYSGINNSILEDVDNISYFIGHKPTILIKQSHRYN